MKVIQEKYIKCVNLFFFEYLHTIKSASVNIPKIFFFIIHSYSPGI